MHPEEPGDFAVFERFADTDNLVAVSCTWTHAKAKSVGNIVWVHHLLVSNREHLYAGLIKSLVGQVKDTISQAGAAPVLPARLIPFERVGIPGDGRCAWRAILCSQDVEAFKRIPRTEGQSLNTTPGARST